MSKFNIEGKKKKLAEMLANPTEYKTDKEIYKSLGISHDTFYRWLREDPEICKYAGDLIDKYTNKELGVVWAALIQQCKKGNVAAIRLFFELKGKHKQQIDVSGSLSANINANNPFADLTTEELRKLINE